MKKILIAAALTLSPCALFAGRMHWEIGLQMYRDLAENKGIFSAGASNVRIVYALESGIDDKILAHVPDFQATNGPFTFIDPSAVITVEHNGKIVNGTFSFGTGSGDSIRYSSVEVRGSHRYQPIAWHDYLLDRMDKIAVDVVPSTLIDSRATYDALFAAQAQVMRVGSGRQQVYNSEGGSVSEGGYTQVSGAYNYLTAGTIGNYANHGSEANTFIWWDDASAGYITDKSPMPIGIRSGDSGSPIYIWNEANQRYELFAVTQAEGGTLCVARMGIDETQAMLDSFNTHVSVGDATVLNWNAANTLNTEPEKQYDKTSVVYTGTISDASGNKLTDYVGLQEGHKTWNTINVDTEKWYAWNPGGINWESASGMHAVGGKELFDNKNIVFYGGGKEVTINMQANVDLGIGNIQFDARASKEDAGELSATKFILKSASEASYTLDSAGFIVNKDVTLVNKLTGEKGVEWRKIGEGTLEIAGTGDNNASLSLGGAGTTFLNREGGYGAYNAFLATGAVLKLKDIQQVKRDVTIGANGGTLDLNGNAYTWENGSGNAFTLRIITEEGIIANNNAETVSVLTLKKLGNEAAKPKSETFLGSFRGNLSVVYDGGSGNSLNLHSIATQLDEGQKFSIKSGNVNFSGRLTEHAGDYVNENDWHYASAKMDVEVGTDGTFVLGSHAKLSGNVGVKNGGNFVMTENVRYAQEYVEGTYWTVDVTTPELRECYGLKGNIDVEAGGNLKISLSENAETAFVYGGNISGAGNFEISAKNTEVRLSGSNTLTGTKTLSDGTLIFELENALDGGKWTIGANSMVGLVGATNLTKLEAGIDAEKSTGTLLLMSNVETQLSSNFDKMIVGAYSGLSEGVHYGTAATALSAKEIAGTGQKGWELGGGAGTLYVDFLLADDNLKSGNTLFVGREGDTGRVILTNENNSFSGGIVIANGFDLEYTSVAALGNAKIELAYGSIFALSDSNISKFIAPNSQGTLLVSQADTWTGTLDLTTIPNLALGAEGSQSLATQIQIAEGASYCFGGMGTLDVRDSLSGAHDIRVDAQGRSGGKIIFNGENTATGTLLVCGYDSTKNSAITSGDITVELRRENWLNSLAGVSLFDGGTLKLNGNAQIIKQLQLNSGGSLDLQGAQVEVQSIGTSVSTGAKIINTAETAGTVVFTNDETAQSFSGDIFGAIKLVKRGDADLSLLGEFGGDSGTPQIYVEKGKLFVGENRSISCAITVNEGASLAFQNSPVTIEASILGENSSLFLSKADNAYTLQKSGSGKFEVTGAISNITSYTHQGGTTHFAKNGEQAFSVIQQTGGTINIGNTNSSEKVHLTIEKFNGVANWSAQGTLNILENGVLTVTGKVTTGKPGNYGALQLSNYGANTIVNINGVLNMSNAGISNRDGAGTININQGGELNFAKGLTVATNNSGANIRINVNDGGRLNTTGLANSMLNVWGTEAISQNYSLNFYGNSTLGTLAKTWSSARNFNFDGNTTIDTTLMVYHSDGKATASTTDLEGASITLSGNISGNGGLIKAGAGTLTLTGTLGYQGETSVSAGTLALGGTVRLSSTIQNSATVQLLDGVKFSLSSLNASNGNTYVLIDSTQGGKVLGDFSEKNLFLEEFRNTPSISNTGDKITVTLNGNAQGIIWNGTDGSAWNLSDQNWTNDGNSDRFYLYDNVEFTGTGAGSFNTDSSSGNYMKTSGGIVSFAAGSTIVANDVTLSSGAYVFAPTGNTVTELRGKTLTISNGATLSIGNSESHNMLLNFDNINLAGGSIVYNNGVTNLKKVSYTQNGSTFYIFDALQAGFSIDEISVEDGITGEIRSRWGTSNAITQISINKIVGTGTLSITGPTSSETHEYYLGRLDQFTGTLNVGKSSKSGSATPILRFTKNTATSATVNFNNGVTVHVVDGIQATISGRLSGAFTKQGWGTFKLTGAQAMTQVITVNDGILDLTEVSRSDNSGSGKLIISRGTVKLATYGWGLNANFGANFNSDRIQLKNSGSVDFVKAGKSDAGFNVPDTSQGIVRFSADAGTLIIGEGNASYHCVNLVHDATFTLDVVNKDAVMDFQKYISGNANKGAATRAKVTKIGEGTLILSADNNTYSGGTEIYAGTLIANHANALGTGNIKIDGGYLQIGSNENARAELISPVLTKEVTLVLDGENYIGKAAISGTGSLGKGSKIIVSKKAGSVFDLSNVYQIYSNGNLSDVSVEFESNSDFTGWEIAQVSGAWVVKSVMHSVPEPALFGFLSGITSLALIATRRRKK